MQIKNNLRMGKFWVLDFVEEDEIYDSPAWDMPGHAQGAKGQIPRRKSRKKRPR